MARRTLAAVALCLAAAAPRHAPAQQQQQQQQPPQPASSRPRDRVALEQYLDWEDVQTRSSRPTAADHLHAAAGSTR